jgi:hypothetical protein
MKSKFLIFICCLLGVGIMFSACVTSKNTTPTTPPPIPTPTITPTPLPFWTPIPTATPYITIWVYDSASVGVSMSIDGGPNVYVYSPTVPVTFMSAVSGTHTFSTPGYPHINWYNGNSLYYDVGYSCTSSYLTVGGFYEIDMVQTGMATSGSTCGGSEPCPIYYISWSCP